jgi:preprotein translocase subunit SecF
MEFFRKETHIDFVASFPYCAIGSVLCIALGLGYTAIKGLNFGTDFAGGYEIQAKFPQPVSEEALRAAIEPTGIGDAKVQRYGPASENEALILIRKHGTIGAEQKVSLEGCFEEAAGAREKLRNFSVAESGEMVMAAFGVPVTEA